MDLQLPYLHVLLMRFLNDSVYLYNLVAETWIRSSKSFSKRRGRRMRITFLARRTLASPQKGDQCWGRQKPLAMRFGWQHFHATFALELFTCSGTRSSYARESMVRETRFTNIFHVTHVSVSVVIVVLKLCTR